MIEDVQVPISVLIMSKNMAFKMEVCHGTSHAHI